MVMALVEKTIQLLFGSIELAGLLALGDRYFRIQRWESTNTINVDRLRSSHQLSFYLSEWRESEPAINSLEG
ncbi:MAG: hypothetical protein HC778_09025 [Chamaesiphon sp. CSU_1_12]|nr:hypothetical protein [Chamaesiphon sp. CSU_1_12]